MVALEATLNFVKEIESINPDLIDDLWKELENFDFAELFASDSISTDDIDGMLDVMTSIKDDDLNMIKVLVAQIDLTTGEIDLSSADIIAEFNIFQRNIFAYIVKMYSKTMKMEQEFSLVTAIFEIKYEDLELNGFATFFSSIVFR